MNRNRLWILVTIACVLVLTLACNLTEKISSETETTASEAAATAPENTAIASYTSTPASAEASAATATAVSTAIPSVAGEQPVEISGEFTYTNEFYPEGYAYEHMVVLLDMTGFVTRDEEWIVPVESQVIGFVKMNQDENTGEFLLRLPELPAGSLNDVDNNGQTDQGVQIFALEYNANWTGGPFFEGDDIYRGWASYLASVITDSENHNEVTGGTLIVWAPDNAQSFPTSFGADGLLFTGDDPVAPLEAGYSLIDLNQEPFGIIRETSPKITLYEPSDAAVKDFSDLSYTESFDKMFEIIRKEYAFNGIEGKQPDWDTLYSELIPKVEQAEANNDSYAYYMVLRELALSFKDGHVGLDGGDVGSNYTYEYIAGGYGFAVRELSDGKVIVVYVQPGGPAEAAGIQLGAELIKIDGVPVSDAIAATQPYSPQSTDYGLRYEQTVFVLRSPLSTEKSFSIANPGSGEKTYKLTSIMEFDSLYATYMGGDYDEYALPIESRILDSGIGYVRINSNSDDLNLSYRLFERALETFEEAEVLGVIIDMRLDFGGSPLGLAGYLYDQEITLGQLQYYNETTGQFESEGEPDTIMPSENQFKFDKIVLMVDQFCYSACEIDAYGLSQIPGIVVIGEYPTAGVEAETARGNFKLPDGMEFSIPTGRFILPDGSIFLEGVGVQPTVRLEVTVDSVLSEEDAVLKAAEEEILD